MPLKGVRSGFLVPRPASDILPKPAGKVPRLRIDFSDGQSFIYILSRSEEPKSLGGGTQERSIPADDDLDGKVAQ
jgi:hypothetical protein